MGLDFHTWWACDLGREMTREPAKDLLVVSVNGGVFNVGFTSEDSVRVRDIVNSRIGGGTAVEGVRVDEKEKI